jgi:hypothetical protein
LKAQQAQTAKKMRTRMGEEEQAEQAKKAKFDNLSTLEGLTAHEFVEMRKRNFYALPRNSWDQWFFRKEQELIVNKFYASLKKWPVCPPTVLDFAHFERHRAYFEEAVWIKQKFGLYPLMKIQEDYNWSNNSLLLSCLVMGMSYP